MSKPSKLTRLKRRHKSELAELRRRLEAYGVAEDEIERTVDRLRIDQELHRSIVAGQKPVTEPDDSKHRPGSVDPLLKGAARVTGQTAAAVKRGKTMTKYQHRAIERRQENT